MRVQQNGNRGGKTESADKRTIDRSATHPCTPVDTACVEKRWRAGENSIHGRESNDILSVLKGYDKTKPGKACNEKELHHRPLQIGERDRDGADT
jgi:hypothetical protein